jgi:redox-sensitive bicupin YhaK (pirin superfamily)
MPKGDPAGRMHGFQLWANLPAAMKMTDPRYQDIPSKEIPELADDDGTKIRVVCGNYRGTKGPVEGVAADPQYLDVWVPPGKRKEIPVETDRNAFAYVFEGDGRFKDASDLQPVKTDRVGPHGEETVDLIGNRSLVLFDTGDRIVVNAGQSGMRFLMVSGRPLEEPVAWAGPIVMNTKEELRQAYSELQDGTFIRKRGTTKKP